MTNHMASVHQMLVTNVLSPMTATARTLFGKQVVPGTPGVQGNSAGQVTSPLLVDEPTFICGECDEECTTEEDMRIHKTEAHDEAFNADENDVAGNELQDEEEFLGDEDDEKDLYDALDALTQNVVGPEKEMEIKDKLVRYRNILINKTQLQEKTQKVLKEVRDEATKSKEVEVRQFKELEQKGKEVEKLTKEVRHLKKQNNDLREDGKKKDAAITQLKEVIASDKEVEVIEQRVNMDKDTSGHNCNACNKKFRTSHDLENHIEARHTESKCTYCNKKFHSERELTNHHKSCVDEGLRTSKCNNCQKVLNGFAMRRHKEQCHDKQMFDCPECGQMCDSAIDVKRHYDFQHKMEPVRNNEVCKHWRKGHCVKGDQCNYAHVGHQNSGDLRTTREKTTRVPACKHGSNCDWMKRGACSYFHRGVGVQKPWNNRVRGLGQDERQPSRNQTNPWRQSERPSNLSDGRSERSNSHGRSERSHNCPCVNSIEDFPILRGERHTTQQQNQNQGRRRN